MSNTPQPYTFDRVVRLIISAALLVAVFALLRYLSDVLLPFAAAVVLAYLLNPLVTLFERKTHRRGFAVALTLGGLAIVAMALVLIVVPLVAGQVSRFSANLHTLQTDLTAAVAAKVNAAAAEPPPHGSDTTEGDSSAENGADAGTSALGVRELIEHWPQFRRGLRDDRQSAWQGLLDAVSGTLVGGVLVESADFISSERFEDFILDAAKGLAVGGWNVLSMVLNFLIALTGLIIVGLYLGFLLLDFPEYARTWQSFLPPAYRPAIVEFLAEFNVAMRRYFRGQSIVAGLTGALFAIGFSIIGLPLAVPFGLFVGLLNMVPYLQVVALVPAALLAVLRSVEDGGSLTASLLLVLAVFAVAQLIQDTIITPRIMGKATGLRPVAILLGIFIWGKLLGFLGLMLAIPLTCLGIAYYRRWILMHPVAETKIAKEGTS